jgi:glyoxylase-like metal-dependent hydrolase (beta-lactamase superfamily II)
VTEVGQGVARAARACSLELGEAKLTYLPDGYYLADPAEQFPGSDTAFWCAHPEVLDPAGMLVMSVGSILLQAPGTVALIDTGTGPRDLDVEAVTGGAFRGRLAGGRLLDSLAGAGLQPADVEHVIYTHLHIDHTGWIVDERGHRVFPNAEYHVADAELDFWSQPAVLASGHGPSELELEVLRSASGQLETGSGLELWPTPGHTPGHQSVTVTSARGSVVVLGDAVHTPVELTTDGLGFVNDADPAQARLSRQALLDRLSQPGHWFAGAHFPDDIFGELRHDEKGRFLISRS